MLRGQLILYRLFYAHQGNCASPSLTYSSNMDLYDWCHLLSAGLPSTISPAAHKIRNWSTSRRVSLSGTRI
jgi:hypothetical protein